jgi:hypothetical protein
MGATKDMFKGEWLEQSWYFHDWPEWDGESTMTHSERCIQLIIDAIKPWITSQ